MGYQNAPHGSLGLPCELYQFMSLTEGTELPFELSLNRCFTPPWAPHPPPIDLIRDITGTEKNSLKNQQLLNS